MIHIFSTQTGATPLYIASQKGHNSVVNSLLKNGADINLKHKMVIKPLIIYRERSLLILLEERGMLPLSICLSGDTHAHTTSICQFSTDHAVKTQINTE